MNKKDQYISPENRVDFSNEVIAKIRSFPVARTVKHCDSTFSVSPFDIYVDCPKCKLQIKLRSFSASCELEDVFDAVFTWLITPDAQNIFKKRQYEIIEDIDEE